MEKLPGPGGGQEEPGCERMAREEREGWRGFKAGK